MTSIAKTAAVACAICVGVLATSPAFAHPSHHDKAMIAASEVVELCAAHAIKDVTCDYARELERKMNKTPCWESNQC